MLNLIIKILSIFLISISVSIAKDLNHSESLDLYNNKILIIDVRNKSEWKETGIIPGVKLVQMLTPNMTLRNDFIDDLVSVIGNDKSIEVGIICRSGNRSSAAVTMLKEKGYKVAAIYAGNDEVATKFSRENNIEVFKWSIGNYAECVAGIKRVEERLGPVDVLVNNAGITKDSMFHKMSKEQWCDVININLNGLFNMTHPIISI